MSKTASSSFAPRLAVLAITGALGNAAQAVEYTHVVPEESAVTFGYTQMGVGMEGRFRKFNATVRFDPAHPEAAQAELTVDVGSIDTGLDEANGEAAGKAWFDAAHFPTASFIATSVKATGPQRYTATGRFTLKRTTHDITVPVEMTLEGEKAVLSGHFQIARNDYAIGEGAWSATDVVANPVDVGFRLTLLGH